MKRLLLAPLLVLPLLVGCGTESTPPVAADPGTDEQAPPAGDYLVEGLPAPFHEGDVLRVGLDDGQVSFSATCNQLSGRADWVDGTLQVSSIGGTEMGCPGDGFAQDEWLVDFFSSGPSVRVDGTDVRLATGGTELWLVPADEVDGGGEGPSAPLEGTRWTLTGIEEADGDSVGVMVVPGRVEAWLELADGELLFRSGCNAGGGPAEVVGDRIELGEIAIELKGCLGIEGEVEQMSVPVLMASSATWSITGDQLRLTRGDTTLLYTAGAVEVSGSSD